MRSAAGLQACSRFAYFTAFILLPALAAAQTAPIWPGVRAPIFGVPVASSGVTSGGVVTSPQLLWPDGTVLLPGMAPASDPNTGWYWTSDGAILMSINGVLTHQWGNTYYANSSNSACMQFGAAGDTTWCRTAGPIWTSNRPITITNPSFSTGVGQGTYATFGNGTNELFSFVVDSGNDAFLTVGKSGVSNGGIKTAANSLYLGAGGSVHANLTATAFNPQTTGTETLGNASNIWGSVFANNYRLAAPFAINTAPSGPVACTTPTVTWSNGTAVFQIDVGGTCAGISTLVITLPAATNGWECTASNTTTAARDVWATAWTTTSVTFTNTARTTGLATDWVDGADIRIKCMAG